MFNSVETHPNELSTRDRAPHFPSPRKKKASRSIPLFSCRFHTIIIVIEHCLCVLTCFFSSSATLWYIRILHHFTSPSTFNGRKLNQAKTMHQYELHKLVVCLCMWTQLLASISYTLDSYRAERCRKKKEYTNKSLIIPFPLFQHPQCNFV